MADEKLYLRPLRSGNQSVIAPFRLGNFGKFTKSGRAKIMTKKKAGYKNSSNKK